MMRFVVVLVALILLIGKAGAVEITVRAYVLYGQCGSFMSRGMKDLATSLEKLDARLKVSVHEWKTHKDIAKEISKLSTEARLVLIGYSLGANATTWIAKPSRTIDLLVAYDPSVLAKLDPAGSNVQRILLLS